MKRDPSLRHLPQTESSGLPAWTAKRWILVGTWAACCVLLIVLLFTEARFLPAVTSRGVHKVVAAADVTRYFKASSSAVRNSQQQADSGRTNATQNATDADLHQLWGALPFTPVLRNNTSTYEYDYKEREDNAGQDGQYDSHAAPGAAAVQQYMLAPLQHPNLANPTQKDLKFMAALVAEILDARITPEEGKAGFKKAFEGTKPPADSPWHIRSPLASNWQRKQHKGAEYQEAADHDSSSSRGRGIKGSGGGGGNVPAGTDQKQQQQPQLLAEQQRSICATNAAERLMSHALALLSGSNRLASCGTEDDSLPLPPVETAGGPPGGRVLLAAALQDNEAAMPNFVLQVVLFAMQAAPASVFVSIFESGSTDQTAFWLDVLKLLLLPLRVPAVITTNGSLDTDPRASPVKYQAARRNMAIDKFFPPTGTINCPSTSSSSSSRDNGNGSIARDLLTGSGSADVSASLAVQQQQPGGQYMALPSPQQQQQLGQGWQQLALRKMSRKLVGSLMHVPVMRDATNMLQAAAHTFAADDDAAAGGPIENVAGDPSMLRKDSSDVYGMINGAAAAAAEAEAGGWGFAYQNPDSFYSSSSSSSRNSSSNFAIGADFVLPSSREALAVSTSTTGNSSSSSSSRRTAENKEPRTPDTYSSSSSSSRSTTASATAESAGVSVSQLAPCFKPDWVLFIDSGVFFCKADLHRLLMHKTADLACGLNLKLAEPAVSSAGSTAGSTNDHLNLNLAEPAVHNDGSTNGSGASTADSITIEALGGSTTRSTSDRALDASGGSTGSSTVGTVEAAGGSTTSSTSSATHNNTGSSTMDASAGSTISSTLGITGSSTRSSTIEAPGRTTTTSGTEISAEPAAAAMAANAPFYNDNALGEQLAATPAMPTAPIATGAPADAATGLPSALAPQQQQQQVVKQPLIRQEQLSLGDVLHSSDWRQQRDVLIRVVSEQDLQAPTVTQQQQQQQQQQRRHYALSDVPAKQPLGNAVRPGQQLVGQQQAVQQLASTPNSSSSSSALGGDNGSGGMVVTPPPAAAVNPTLAKFPFYYGDYGVGRMVTGGLLDAVPPYAAAHLATVRRLSAGLPVQVYCCWNGLAKLRAEPFQRGLRFRASMESECKTSEKALLCDDFHRLGFSKALVDSGVLVTHQLELSARISNTIKHAQRMPYIRRSRWVEVQGGGSPWLRNELQLRQQTYPALICCDSQDARQAMNDHQLFGGNYSFAAGAGQPKNQILGGNWGLGSGFSMTYEELVTGVEAGRWRIGSDSTSERQCRAVRPLANNHTAAFLQRRQQG